MTFKEAIERGLNAHQRASAARTEINEVLTQASDEIQAVVNAPITLSVDVIDQPARAQTTHEQIAGLAAPREKVTMLIARNQRGAWESLARMNLAETGFPVDLQWGNHYQRAVNREEFSSLVSAVLASGSTGEKIARLAALPQMK